MTPEQQALARLEDLAKRSPGSFERHIVTADRSELAKLRADLGLALSIIAEARTVLEPFAEDARGIHPEWSDERRRATLTQSKPLRLAHFRAARSLHSKITGGAE